MKLTRSNERNTISLVHLGQTVISLNIIFNAILKEAPMFGKGKQLGKDYFEIMEGLTMFFYDSDSVKQEFGKYGLIELSEIVEPHKNMENKPPFKFIMVKCQREQ